MCSNVYALSALLIKHCEWFCSAVLSITRIIAHQRLPCINANLCSIQAEESRALAEMDLIFASDDFDDVMMPAPPRYSLAGAAMPVSAGCPAPQAFAGYGGQPMAAPYGPRVQVPLKHGHIRTIVPRCASATVRSRVYGFITTCAFDLRRLAGGLDDRASLQPFHARQLQLLT